MGTVNELLSWARAQVGASSGRSYWKYVYGYESSLDWCAVFCSAALKATNTKCVYFPSTFAFDKRDLKVIGDRWVGPYDLKPGDILAFDFDGGGQWGGDHVGIVDAVLGYGYYRTIEGNVSKSCKYKWRRVEADGIIGGLRPEYSNAPSPSTISSKLIVDGDFGPFTCKELQKALQKHGYYLTYLVDGDFGYYTKEALQRYLRDKGFYHWAIDGDFGFYSKRALQEYLSNAGYYTGYLLDGDWGYYTTCALQNCLNDGKF